MKRLRGEITLQEIAAVYPALALVADSALRLPPVDPETAEYLDGPAFVKWLYGHGLREKKQFGPTIERRLTDWQDGFPVSIEYADRIMVALDLRLSEVPDELWIRPPIKTPSAPLDPDTRERIAERYRHGETAPALAREFGVSARAVRKWARGK